MKLTGAVSLLIASQKSLSAAVKQHEAPHHGEEDASSLLTSAAHPLGIRTSTKNKKHHSEDLDPSILFDPESRDDADLNGPEAKGKSSFGSGENARPSMFAKGQRLKNRTIAKKSDSADRQECDPTVERDSTEASVGILSCEQGYICTPNDVSSAGGLCLPEKETSPSAGQVLKSRPTKDIISPAKLHRIQKREEQAAQSVPCDPLLGVLACEEEGKVCEPWEEEGVGICVDESSEQDGYSDMMMIDEEEERRLGWWNHHYYHHHYYYRHHRYWYHGDLDCDYSHYNYHRHSGTIYCSSDVDRCENDVCKTSFQYDYTYRHGRLVKFKGCIELDGHDVNYQDHEYCVLHNYRHGGSCEIYLYGEKCDSCRPLDKDHHCFRFDCTNTPAGTSGDSCYHTVSPLHDVYHGYIYYSKDPHYYDGYYGYDHQHCDFSNFEHPTHHGKIICYEHRECRYGVCSTNYYKLYDYYHGYLDKYSLCTELDGQGKHGYRDHNFCITKNYYKGKCSIEMYGKRCHSCHLDYWNPHDSCYDFDCTNTRAHTHGNSCSDLVDPLRDIYLGYWYSYYDYYYLDCDYSHYNYHRHSGSITCSGHRECCNGVCQYPHKYQYTVRHGYITKCTTVLELDGQDRGYYEDQAYKIVKDYKDEECHIEVYDQECESCTMTYNDAIHEWCLEFSCLNTNATTSGNTCDQDYASPLKGIFEKAPQYSEF